MKTATSLTVIAIGAILAFAVTASPSFLNVQTVGWILMLTGLGGLLLRQRNRDWLRRIIIRPAPAAPGARRPAARQLSAGPSIAQATPSSTRPSDHTEPIEQDTIEEYIEQ